MPVTRRPSSRRRSHIIYIYQEVSYHFLFNILDLIKHIFMASVYRECLAFVSFKNSQLTKLILKMLNTKILSIFFTVSREGNIKYVIWKTSSVKNFQQIFLKCEIFLLLRKKHYAISSKKGNFQETSSNLNENNLFVRINMTFHNNLFVQCIKIVVLHSKVEHIKYTHMF